MASVPANRWPYRSARPVVIMPPIEVPQAMVRRAGPKRSRNSIEGGELGGQRPLHHPAGLRVGGADLGVPGVEQRDRTASLGAF